MITPVSAYVNVSYFFIIPAFLNVSIYFCFRFLQKQMSALLLIASHFHQGKHLWQNKNFVF